MLNVINSTIFGNTAYGSGGGISLYSGTIDIGNSTIAANKVTSASNSGGGIHAYYSDSGEMSIRNSIVANNTSKSIRQDMYLATNESGKTVDVTDNGYNVMGVTNGHTWTGTGDWTIVGATGDKYTNGTTARALKLSASLANNGGTTNTLKLNTGSIAINAIPYVDETFHWNNSPDTNQRGYLRLEGAATSIGAYASN